MSVSFKYFIANVEIRQANELLCVSHTVAIFVEDISHNTLSAPEHFEIQYRFHIAKFVMINALSCFFCTTSHNLRETAILYHNETKTKESSQFYCLQVLIVYFTS
jgi:hypothetical protein